MIKLKLLASPENEFPPAPADTSLRLRRWLWEETKFHLLPWGPRVLRRSALRGLEFGFAAVVTVAWILSGTGHLGPAVVTAWWTGWSVYELVCRRANLPWIKEGPWWQRNFRRASFADLAAYVATKNLLIGVVLFAMLKSLGVLKLLSESPALNWLH
jgi:NosR/NirI family nitrous oxide reductase transcriptional regulator